MPGSGAQARVYQLLARTSAEDAQRFTHFDLEESVRASELAREMSQIAADRGVEAAVERAEEVADGGSVGLAKHALKLFVTHDADAAGQLTVPAPEPRDSEPLPAPGEEPTAPAEPPPDVPAPPADEPGGGVAVAPAPVVVEPAPVPGRDISRTTPAAEAQLDWYREDPLANDHHHHWHIVYPAGGNVAGAAGGVRTQPRQGELFFYMHQQMLARYDTERVLAGLPRAVPISDYGAPIEEGYALELYGPRPSGRAATDVERIQALETGHAHAEGAIETGGLDVVSQAGAPVGSLAVDENTLGCVIESSLHFAATATRPTRLRYANFHGNGHVLLAGMSDAAEFPGPMAFFETAIRDPVFYRWHRRVDDLYAALQDRQAPNDFAAFAPAGVTFAGEDAIALCFAADIAGADQPGFDFAAWGERELAGGGGPRTDTLLTRFVRSTLMLPDVPDEFEAALIPPEWLAGVVHLTHDPFVLFVRLDNGRDAAAEVTLRVFLAHAGHAGDRRMWIELDKFRATLAPGANLVARPDARSAVVKRKGLTVPGAEAADPQPGETTWWCDCGWPYSLLLPSGASTTEGSPFKLVVALTDWEQDQLGEPSTCGSMSFCGARNEYPYRRRMGYPFDRPFDGGVEPAIAAAPSMALRDVSIRCATQRPAST
jgi:tyrosinase